MINIFLMLCLKRLITLDFLSDLRRLAGHPAVMEEWAGFMGIKTYAMHKTKKESNFSLIRRLEK